MLNGWLLGNEEKENEVHYHIIVRYIGLVCSAVCWRVEWSVEAKVGKRNVLYCGRFSGCLIHAFGKLSTFGWCFCFMTNLDNAAGCAVSGQDYFYPQDEQNRGFKMTNFRSQKWPNWCQSANLWVVVCGETGLVYRSHVLKKAHVSLCGSSGRRKLENNWIMLKCA